MFVCQVADCEVALRLDPGLGKAASRAARAYIAVGLVRMANSVVRPCTVPSCWCAAITTRTLVDTHHAHTLTHASTTSRGAKATLRRRRVTPSPSKRWVDVVRLSCVCVAAGHAAVQVAVVVHGERQGRGRSGAAGAASTDRELLGACLNRVLYAGSYADPSRLVRNCCTRTHTHLFVYQNMVNNAKAALEGRETHSVLRHLEAAHELYATDLEATVIKVRHARWLRCCGYCGLYVPALGTIFNENVAPRVPKSCFSPRVRVCLCGVVQVKALELLRRTSSIVETCKAALPESLMGTAPAFQMPRTFRWWSFVAF